MANIPGWVIITGASVGGTILLLCLFVVVSSMILACLYSSQCVWCPCNRKRGQANLQYMGSHGNSVSRSVINKRTETGVTIYRGPRIEMAASPTPSVESSNVGPLQVSDSTFLVPGSKASLSRFQSSKDGRESSIYVLPNNVNLPNDGFEPTSSWGLEMPEPGIDVTELPTSQSNKKSVSKPSSIVVGALSRVEAERCLNDCGTVGCFLFRKTNNGICLSVLAPDQKCRHLVVDKINNRFYKIKSLPTGSESFKSLADFVTFYTCNEVHFQDGGFSVKLSKLCLY